MNRARLEKPSGVSTLNEGDGLELSESMAALLASADNAEGFATALLRGLAALQPSRHVYVLVHGTHRRPIKHWYRPAEVDVTVYLSLMELDPFAVAIQEGQSGLLTLDGVAPVGFRKSGYYGRNYADQGIIDELIHAVGPVRGLKLGAGVTSSAPFSKEVVSRHETVHPAIRACLLRLAELLMRDGLDADHALPGPIDGAVERFGAGVLTAREQEVVHLILRGHNTESVGHQLGMSWNTARAHRSKAYRKLGVSSQGELFYAFLRTLDIAVDR